MLLKQASSMMKCYPYFFAYYLLLIYMTHIDLVTMAINSNASKEQAMNPPSTSHYLLVNYYAHCFTIMQHD